MSHNLITRRSFLSRTAPVGVVAHGAPAHHYSSSDENSETHARNQF